MSLYVKTVYNINYVETLKIMNTYSRVYLFKSIRTNLALIKIIGVIYKPPNTSVKHFNEKLENVLGLI